MSILGIDVGSEILPLGQIGSFENLPLKGIDYCRRELLKNLKEARHEWSCSFLLHELERVYSHAGMVVEVEVEIYNMPWMAVLHTVEWWPPHQLFMPKVTLLDYDHNRYTARSPFLYIGESIKLDVGRCRVDVQDYDGTNVGIANLYRNSPEVYDAARIVHWFSLGSEEHAIELRRAGLLTDRNLNIDNYGYLTDY